LFDRPLQQFVSSYTEEGEMIKRIVSLLLVTTGLIVLGSGLLLFGTPGLDVPVAKAAPAQLAPHATLVATGTVTEGAYIVNLALGCGCHFNGELGGLAGGEDFSGPYGQVFARNITPDPETGIGSYTPEELETVIRTGKRPNGQQLFPAMPYMHFSGIAEDDMDDLITFLLEGQTPISNTIPPHDLLTEPEPFTPTVAPPATAPVFGTERGEYIVNTLAVCGDCHGPNLAGTPGFAPNITSDPIYGLGSLTPTQISDMLHTGVRPVISDSVRFDGSHIGSIMGQIIQSDISKWTVTDTLAVGEYLLTVPAVGNQAPVFVSEPVTTTEVGESYVYTAQVTDIDIGDTLTVTASVKPDWLSLGPTTTAGRPPFGSAVLSGTATMTDVGESLVVLVASDTSGATATQTFTITVQSPLDDWMLPIMRKDSAGR
jgi:hypothetical protein